MKQYMMNSESFQTLRRRVQPNACGIASGTSSRRRHAIRITSDTAYCESPWEPARQPQFETTSALKDGAPVR